MQIKRFRGPSVKEALAMVKKEFGSEALIVETKTLGKGVSEVVAAIDRDEPVAASQQQSAGVSADYLLNEMQEIKELLVSMAGNGEGEGDALRVFRKELQKNGLDGALVMRLLARARAEEGRRNGAGAVRNGGTEMAGLRKAVRRELGRTISVKDPLKDARVISFIGPTGAGKTTTVAKLAAMAKLGQKKKVALLTMDTFRIGAPDQILKYAKMMDAPVGVASTVDEAAEFMKKQAGADLVLIDTPGSNPRMDSHVRDLQALAGRVPGLKFNLVLSVRDRDDSLYESIKGLGPLPVDSLTFTRLDEAGSFGQMLGVSVRAKRPIGLLGTGQKVPGDLVEATVEKVLGYLMPG